MKQTEKIDITQSRSIMLIFSDCISFLKQSWRDFFRPILLYGLPIYIIGFYFMHKANLQIIETKSIFNNSNLHKAIIINFIADAVFNAIVYATLIAYIQQKKIELKSVIFQFNSIVKRAFVATIISQFIISIGFALFFVPGILLSVPMMLFVFIYLYYNRSISDTMNFSFQLVRSNPALAYKTILLSYLTLFIVKLFLESFISVDASLSLVPYITLQLLGRLAYSVILLLVTMTYFSLVNTTITHDTYK